MPQVAYTRGLHELGDGLYAYLQPDGGWGWSNAGLITGEETSLLVDTLYDLTLTRAMLEAMAASAQEMGQLSPAVLDARDVRRYLAYIADEAGQRFTAGMDPAQAANDIDISDFADWGDPERIAANVMAAYRELDPTLPKATPPELFVRMAAWRAAH